MKNLLKKILYCIIPGLKQYYIEKELNLTSLEHMYSKRMKRHLAQVERFKPRPNKILK